MSDDEEDYMSDKFLNEAVTKDPRPGLLLSHKQKRDHELWKKKGQTSEENKVKNKPRGVLEDEMRSDGLLKPIAADNKGFAMLAKMGFNPGEGLGKDRQGRTEPVDIEIKTDKQGLGRKAAIKEVLQAKRKMLEERKKNALSVEDYRASLSEKIQERKTHLDLMKSQRICHTLDKEWNIEEPEEMWFWPEFAQEKNEEEESDEEDESEKMDFEEMELSTKEKLELITLYLRRTHFYCIWCGVRYQDDDDMKDCPGPTAYDHDD